MVQESDSVLFPLSGDVGAVTKAPHHVGQLVKSLDQSTGTILAGMRREVVMIGRKDDGAIAVRTERLIRGTTSCSRHWHIESEQPYLKLKCRSTWLETLCVFNIQCSGTYNDPSGRGASAWLDSWLRKITVSRFCSKEYSKKM